jgi:hypothetical protein
MIEIEVEINVDILVAKGAKISISMFIVEFFSFSFHMWKFLYPKLSFEKGLHLCSGLLYYLSSLVIVRLGYWKLDKSFVDKKVIQILNYSYNVKKNSIDY